MREGELPRSAAGYLAGAGGVRLFYRVDGGGPDTVVVFHGGPGLNLEGLRPDLRPLGRRHALLYFDQRGSGWSDMPDSLALTAALMVEDVEAIRRAFHLEQVTILGHSWGGALAVLYAARNPEHVRRIILVGSVPPRLHPYFDQYATGAEARHDSAETADMARLDSIGQVASDPHPACREATRLYLHGVAATPEAAGRIKGDLCAGTPTNVRSQGLVLRQVWTSILPPNLPEDYYWTPLAKRIEAPTLVVHGAEDPMPLAGSAEWARAFPRGRLVVIPGAGHYPHAERPEEFFRAVETFLADSSQRAGR